MLKGVLPNRFLLLSVSLSPSQTNDLEDFIRVAVDRWCTANKGKWFGAWELFGRASGTWVSDPLKTLKNISQGNASFDLGKVLWNVL